MLTGKNNGPEEGANYLNMKMESAGGKVKFYRVLHWVLCCVLKCQPQTVLEIFLHETNNL